MAEKKKLNLYPLHLIIGLGIMVFFWLAPPIGAITPIGMRCIGAFVGMVYLWSAVDALWPSVLGILLIALSGYSGEGVAGLKAGIMAAFGNDVAVLMIFVMVLFGALHEVGCTKYIANWFITRKVVTGRPYTFLLLFYIGCFVLGALVSPIVSLILLWPIALQIMAMVGVERTDRLWPYFFVGMFVVSALAMPFFPFMSAQLVVVSAFEAMTQGAYPVLTNMAPYMALNGIMTWIIFGIYLLFMKFVLRVDVSKLKAIDAEKIKTENALPPLNITQKSFLIMVPLYLAMLILPSFVPSMPGAGVLKLLGVLGVSVLWLLVFLIIRVDGKPMLNFKEVAYRQFNWGIYFMVVAAIYGANSLSNAITGVPDFLLATLDPLLGGRSEMGFVFIMFAVALILTNLANNAAMAVILMPVVLAFSGQLGISPLPVAMGVCMMVFVAMLTPAASPHSGMMHGRRDIYTTGEIWKIGAPVCVLSLFAYVYIGYPLAKVLFGV